MGRLVPAFGGHQIVDGFQLAFVGLGVVRHDGSTVVLFCLCMITQSFQSGGLIDIQTGLLLVDEGRVGVGQLLVVVEQLLELLCPLVGFLETVHLQIVIRDGDDTDDGCSEVGTRGRLFNDVAQQTVRFVEVVLCLDGTAQLHLTAADGGLQTGIVAVMVIAGVGHLVECRYGNFHGRLIFSFQQQGGSQSVGRFCIVLQALVVVYLCADGLFPVFLCQSHHALP